MKVLTNYILLTTNILFSNKKIIEKLSPQLKTYDERLLAIENKYRSDKNSLINIIDNILKKYKNINKDLLYTDNKKFRYIFYDYKIIVNDRDNIIKDDNKKDFEILQSYKDNNNRLLKELYELSNDINQSMINNKKEIIFEKFNKNNINLEDFTENIFKPLMTICFNIFILINKILILYIDPHKDKPFIESMNFKFIETDQADIITKNKEDISLTSMIFVIKISLILKDKNSKDYKKLSQIFYDINLKLLEQFFINLIIFHEVVSMACRLIS